MNMTILRRDDDITHVVLTGRLDTTGAEEIAERLSEATTARGRPAIIDLSGIEFLASRGIGLLFANGKGLMKTGHKLVLLNPQELVESVLKASRVEMVMPIAHDLDEAIRVLGGLPGSSDAASRPGQTAEDDPGPPDPQPAAIARPVSEGHLKLAIKNSLSELESLNATLAQFLETHGVPYRPTYAVNLAIDELVVNVIRYAYVDDDEHLIDIELSIEREQVTLRIVDDGRPFDPRRGPALDLHAEDRQAGGLGILLVLDMVDVLKYQRVDETNHVEVRIRLFASDQQGDLSTGEQSNVS